jgi:hypothetical protein
MLHISSMIEQASESVTQINLTYHRVLASIMSDQSFTQEQKLILISKMEALEESIKKSQNKFCYNVESSD